MAACPLIWLPFSRHPLAGGRAVAALTALVSNSPEIDNLALSPIWLCRENFDARIDTLVADEHRWACDQGLNVVGPLTTERALELFGRPHCRSKVVMNRGRHKVVPTHHWPLKAVLCRGDEIRRPGAKAPGRSRSVPLGRVGPFTIETIWSRRQAPIPLLRGSLTAASNSCEPGTRTPRGLTRPRNHSLPRRPARHRSRWPPRSGRW
jgi:hypothetical protein